MTRRPRVVEWQIAVRDHPDLSPTAQHVALIVSTYMKGDSLKAWPSIDTLCAKTGRSRKTLLRARAELIDAGMLEVLSGGGRGRSTQYAGMLTNSGVRTPVYQQKQCRQDTSFEDETVALATVKSGTTTPGTPPKGGEHDAAAAAAPQGRPAGGAAGDATAPTVITQEAMKTLGSRVDALMIRLDDHDERLGIPDDAAYRLQTSSTLEKHLEHYGYGLDAHTVQVTEAQANEVLAACAALDDWLECGAEPPAWMGPTLRRQRNFLAADVKLMERAS